MSKTDQQLEMMSSTRTFQDVCLLRKCNEHTLC